jgi:hypothetical protein
LHREYPGYISTFLSVTGSKLFPTMLLLCNLGSSVASAIAGDWRRAVYWAASSVCIAAVTF